MLDALAYLKAARSLAVAALEVSRSGVGAHVWVFFHRPGPGRDGPPLGHRLSVRLSLPSIVKADFAPDVSHAEQALLIATQSPTSLAALAQPSSAPAWKTIPSWASTRSPAMPICGNARLRPVTTPRTGWATSARPP